MGSFRKKRWMAGCAAVAAAALTPLAPVQAQSGNPVSLPPAISAKGPTVVHDTNYKDAKTEIHSIAVPFSNLSLVILNVSGMPQSARFKTFGAHIHARACGDDATASGPHHANPAGDPSTSLMSREVWLDFNVDYSGKGTGIALYGWAIRKGDAGSVVIHAEPTNLTTGAAGARIMCTSVGFGA